KDRWRISLYVLDVLRNDLALVDIGEYAIERDHALVEWNRGGEVREQRANLIPLQCGEVRFRSSARDCATDARLRACDVHSSGLVSARSLVEAICSCRAERADFLGSERLRRLPPTSTDRVLGVLIAKVKA